MASDYSVALVKVLPITTAWASDQANHVALPTPSNYKMTSSTLVDNSRNSSGIVIGQTVREGVRKIEMTWNFLDQTQFSLIAKLFESASVGGTGNFMCYLYYYDTIRGAYIDSYTETIGNTGIKRHFYVGDRVSDTAKVKLSANGTIEGYANVKLSLIEC